MNQPAPFQTPEEQELAKAFDDHRIIMKEDLGAKSQRAKLGPQIRELAEELNMNIGDGNIPEPLHKNEPWRSLGLSKATWYRRRRLSLPRITPI